MILEQFTAHLQEELKKQLDEKELQNHIYILYQHYLGFNRAEVVINAKSEIDAAKLAKLNTALEALKLHKPIDYIINESVFFGRTFYVDESVLIPRSETEELVLWVLEKEEEEGLTLVDIGSGSGCIPITLALEGKFDRVDALEISTEANETARKNAQLLGVDVLFRDFDILQEVTAQPYDIVVSNPPYVKEEELEQLDKNVIEYEPVIALAPKGDPLTFYKRMIAVAPQLLKEGGRFYWEIHEDLGQEVVALLEAADFSEIELREDLYGRDRLVRARFR